MKKILLSAIACGLLLTTQLYAQFPGCPSVTTATNVTVPCGQTCVNLTANAFAGAQTTTYAVDPIPYTPPFAFNSGTQILVNTDDIWSGVINLPFRFCFFGNGYQSIIVGSNGVCSFNTGNAGAFNNWNIPGPIPSTVRADLQNCIMGPWQDIDPTNSGQVFYEIGGTAPCRYFKVSWYNTPYYGAANSVSTGSCPGQNLRATQQIILYETTNVIDIYIQQKQYCAAWNGGLAVEGIQNAAGTVAFSVPGRNATQWNATNDAYRFRPAGAPNYTIAWFQGATQIGSGSTINVCPSGTTTYTAEATYNSCGVNGTVVSSNVTVSFSGTSAQVDSVHQVSCFNGSDGAVYGSYNAGSAVISYGWSPGGQGQTSLTNIPAGTYVFSVTDAANCTRYDTVVLANPPQLLVNVDDEAVVSCLPGVTTTLTANVTGGTPGYTYSWTGGGSTSSQLTAGAGTYTVTVTDSKSCTASDPGTITVTPGSPGFNAPVIVNATCTAANGSIVVSLSGAPEPVNYSWSPTEPNNDTITGLTSGTYSVTATDANGCSTTASYTVGQNGGISFNAPVITDVVCTANNGTIAVSVAGALDPVNYNWSPSEPNNDTITGLAAGTYAVTATDANGCTATASYTVNQTGGISFGAPVITDATCGGSNGEITVNVVGASGTVNYTWSPAQPNSATVSNLTAGTYNVTAVDANGCSTTASYTVNQTGSISFGQPSITDATCGAANGAITVNVVGAVGTVNYTWSPAQPNSASITGLVSGTYSVTADNNGCTASASYTVGQTGGISFGAPVITTAGCGQGGSITVNVVGATGTVTYQWTAGLPNSNVVTNLSSGSYSVTATDGNGCSATATYNVGQGNAVVINNATVNDVSCTGFGSISVSATGGTGTLTYTWSGNGGPFTGNPLNNLTAGTYNLTVTDQGSCSATGTYIVGQSICGDCPAVATNNNVTIPCGQTCTTLRATAVAGAQTTAYTGSAIAFNPPAAFNTGTPILVNIDDRFSGIINLPFNFCFFGNVYNRLVVGSNGIVSFNVANANGTNNWQINGPVPSTTPADLRNTIMGPWHDMDPTNQGDIYYSITGTYPCRQFIVSWYQTSLYGDPNSVSPGSCNTAYFQRQQIVLYETTNVIDIYIGKKDACQGWNGGLAIEGIQNAAGTVAYTVPGRNATVWTATNDGYRFTPSGAPNYVINWFQGNTQIGTGDSITVCPANSTVYNVQATYTNCDNSTIVVADSVIVNVQGGLTATVDSFQNITCAGGNNGAVYASYTSTGGTVTSFGWSPGGFGQTSLTGLTAGTYIFNVTNAAGCSVSDTVVLTEPNALTVNVPDTALLNCVASPVSVDLTATATGGTAGYTYDWGGGNTNATLTGVGVGTYTVTVTDANGCTASDAGTVTQTIANPVFNQPLITDVTCNGNNDGSIIVSVSQATPAISYNWSPTEPDNDTITGLAAGNYAVTATDANGCSVTASYDINEPAAIVIDSVVLTDATCTVGGTATAYASGGTGTLTITWSNGDLGAFADSLAGGAVTVTVTDANGCSVTATYNVGAVQGTVAFGTPTIVNLTCNGSNDGSITATATGGTGTITFAWANPVSNSATISGLAAGSYSVTITDSLGCSASTTYNVTEPTAIVLGNPVITPATCTALGSVSVTATGGTGTLVYGWSNGDNGTLADSLAGGTTVTLTVTDANGCSVTATYSIPSQSAVTLNTSTFTNITCNGANDGTIHVIAIGATAPVVYTWNPSGTSADSLASGLSAGTYLVTVTDGGGCSATASFTITEPTAITLGNPVITDATCTTGGTITVVATGGTGTLTYGWSNGDNTSLADSLSGGPVTLTVTDANGCSVTASYTIGATGNAVAFGNVTLTQPTCNGGTNGSITVTTTGGAGTIVYNWNPGSSNTATLSGIGAGTYSVTATDSLGCSASNSYTLAEPSAINLGSPVVTQVTCVSGGSVMIEPAGGTGTLVINWSNGDSGMLADSLAAGAVTVTVTDANGCSVTGSYNISNAPGSIVIGTPIINNVSCNGANDGSITINPTGGTGSLTSTWNTVPPTVGNTVTGLAPGSYTVVVTDQGGCSATATYSITQPTVLAVTVDATAVLCFGSTSGTATANATGGTVPSYTYHWNDNQTTQTVSNLPVGIVLVTVTDGNGCTAGASAIIGQSPAISYNSQINQPNCSTLGFGTEILTPRGGTGAIKITINEPGLTLDTTLSMVGGDTVLTYPGVPTGCYDFTLTDAIGCSITGNFCVNAGAAGQTFTATTTPTSCFGKGFNDGSIVVTPGTNDNAPYSYSLGGAAYQPDSIYNNVGAGTYTVYVTNSYGCLDSVVATVNQPAQLLVNATPDTIVTGANVGNQINVTVTNYTNPVYTWTPVAGLSCTDCSNPLATVAVNSVFYVQVSEDGVEGCYASDSVVIIVNGKLKMPNAFSPNTDGKNDTYGPVNGENSALTITAFRIYNRWGQEVHNAAENWNGKFKGEDQPAGTYVYYISVKTPDENNPGQDKTVTDQGAFTLLR